MPSKSKTKGKGYENDVAKFLTEQYGDKFMRVPTSGAFLGGQNYHRRHTMTEGQVRAFKGDIIPPDDWSHFNCECKFYADFSFHQLYSKVAILDKWIDETLATANTRDINVIFMKFNRKGEYVLYPADTAFITDKHTIYHYNGDIWHFTSKDEFWSEHNKTLLKSYSVHGLDQKN